jgi:hypothetical protein
MNSINVTITTKSCDQKGAVIGAFKNGRLDISFSSVPEFIYILTSKPFSANEGELCLGVLREKLCTCEELLVNGYVMKYHNHSPSDYFIGGLIKETLDECFKAIHYHITYSLHKLN